MSKKPPPKQFVKTPINGTKFTLLVSSAKAIFIATVDLPTPPFALEINNVYFVPLIGVLTNCLGGGFLLIMFQYFGHNIAIT